MTAETILKNLGISYPGNYVDENTFVVELDGDQAFGKVYASLDHSDDFELVDENDVSADSIKLVYEDEKDGFSATVEADFNENTYTLTLYEE